MANVNVRCGNFEVAAAVFDNYFLRRRFSDIEAINAKEASVIIDGSGTAFYVQFLATGVYILYRNGIAFR